MKTRTLKAEFLKHGVYYKLHYRINEHAIYALFYGGVGGQNIGFDVVTIQRYTPDYSNPFIANRYSEKWDVVETFPTSEMYGSKAWSFTTLEAAQKKLEELLAGVK